MTEIVDFHAYPDAQGRFGEYGGIYVAETLMEPLAELTAAAASALNAINPIPGADIIHMDFLADDAPDRLKAAMKGEADLVLSDLAPSTTGHSRTDHIRIIALAEMAYDFAAEVLAPGGAFVAKVFQGGSERDLLNRLKQDFTTIRHVKPPASRAESAEVYVVAQGFRRPVTQA